MTIARLMQMARAGVPKGEPWLADLANASYDGVSFSVAAQTTFPVDLVFSNDGNKMYVLGTTNTVYQYSLSTAFNVGTASYDSVSFSVAGQALAARGICFNNDGTKMYAVGTNRDVLYQYTLSTAFNLSTASYSGVSFSVAGQDISPNSMAFGSDGTKMYMAGTSTDSIYQYSLSTAFNVGTASYDSVSFSVAGQDTTPYDLVFNPDGTKMYIMGNATDRVYQYSLSTGFDLSTASYDSVSFLVSSQETTPYALAFKSDGSKMYIAGSTTDTIYQYSTA